VAKILRITGLGTRLRVFATIEQARQRLTAVAPVAASLSAVVLVMPGAGPNGERQR
jgi:hypothetical protein